MPRVSNKEKIELYTNMLQNNLNNYSVREDERCLLDNSKDFANLLKTGIFAYNTKVGVQYNGFWVKNINGGNWMMKIAKNPTYINNVSVVPREFYIQILNERMADACGLNPIHSHVIRFAKNSDLYAIYSKSFCKDGFNNISGRELVVDDYIDDYLLYQDEYLKNNFDISCFEDFANGKFNINSLPVIYQALRNKYEQRTSLPLDEYRPKKVNAIIENIYFELVKRYIFAYITMQYDFHLGNFEIMDDNHSPYLSKMYDLEKSMSSDFYDNEKHTSMRYSVDGSLSMKEDFMSFINASEDNLLLVERMLNLLTPPDICKFMESKNSTDIVFPVAIQKQVLNDYTRHFMDTVDMIQNLKNKKNEDTIKLG